MIGWEHIHMKTLCILLAVAALATAFPARADIAPSKNKCSIARTEAASPAVGLALAPLALFVALALRRRRRGSS
jgi:MYXO-CTERM domain-containing protein